MCNITCKEGLLFYTTGYTQTPHMATIGVVQMIVDPNSRHELGYSIFIETIFSARIIKSLFLYVYNLRQNIIEVPYVCKYVCTYICISCFFAMTSNDNYSAIGLCTATYDTISGSVL